MKMHRVSLTTPVWLFVFAAQGQAQTAQITAFVDDVRKATAIYHDSDQAVRDGFRPIGPDAPGMGRHWVNIGRVLDDRFEPGRPSILTYIDVDGERTLVGVAFALPLSPGEKTPGPFPASAWHVHSGSVADEGALFGHDMAPPEAQDRRGVGVLHVWAWADNPDGLVAPDNWALPFLRQELEAPAGPAMTRRSAALGLALADGADEFISDVLTRHYLNREDDRAHARRILGHHARLQRETMGSGTAPSALQLARAWEVCWDELISGLSGEGKQALILLTRSHTSHELR
jgi:hypothetical protein